MLFRCPICEYVDSQDPQQAESCGQPVLVLPLCPDCESSPMEPVDLKRKEQGE